ncbi:Exported hypothetical protein [Micromonospora lupini str. Lupac 08]|uniref:Uncharacterized protein n=2 Tax=Micromonospora lupini TaxID=285679 RepID=I0L4P5_9ACTN|nr:Exported hypothetical protein [Micromonospora lupini str. Lupac 08]
MALATSTGVAAGGGMALPAPIQVAVVQSAATTGCAAGPPRHRARTGRAHGGQVTPGTGRQKVAVTDGELVARDGAGGRPHGATAGNA